MSCKKCNERRNEAMTHVKRSKNLTEVIDDNDIRKSNCESEDTVGNRHKIYEPRFMMISRERINERV